MLLLSLRVLRSLLLLLLLRLLHLIGGLGTIAGQALRHRHACMTKFQMSRTCGTRHASRSLAAAAAAGRALSERGTKGIPQGLPRTIVQMSSNASTGMQCL